MRLYTKICICFIFLSNFIVSYSFAAKVSKKRILVVKSANLRQFDTVADSFKKSVENFHIDKLTFKKSLSKKQVTNILKKYKPNLLVCLGSTTATTFAKHQNKVPILFTMVLNYKRHKLLKNKHIAGIAMEIPSQNLFTQFKLLYGGLKALAVPYHPVASSETVQSSRATAKFLGVRLLLLPVSNPKDLTSIVRRKIKKMDALWMLSDFKLYNKSNISEVNTLLKLAYKETIPVIVSSEAFLKAGALFAISIDYDGLGSQLGILSSKILLDRIPVVDIGVVPPIGTRTILNMDIAEKLIGSVLNEEEVFDYQADRLYRQNE